MLLEHQDFKIFLEPFSPHHATCGPPLCQASEKEHRLRPHQRERPAVRTGHTKDQVFLLIFHHHLSSLSLIIIMNFTEFMIFMNHYS